MLTRYSRPAMAALWSDEAKLQRWLAVELAHLRALETLGLAPVGSADHVAATAVLDVAQVDAVERTVKHDVIAFLTVVEASAGEPARLLHRGLTSSDVLDTALALALREAGRGLEAELRRLIGALSVKAAEHRGTLCIGRSHGMYAEPTTFGLVLAGHLAEHVRALQQLRLAIDDVSVGSLSGAVGTYAQTPPAAEALALAALGLRAETVPTQVVPRDRHARFFAALASVAQAIERLAVNVRHLARSEVAEVQEAFSTGQRGSSAMPHKKNPILCENLCGLARLVRGYAGMAQENVALWHERDISHSSVERVIAPDATVTLDFMLARTTGLVRELVVHADRMADRAREASAGVLSGNVLLALCDAGMPRQQAYALVQAHALAGGSLHAQVMADAEIRARLDAATLDRCFDLGHHLRHADLVLDRALDEARQVLD